MGSILLIGAGSSSSDSSGLGASPPTITSSATFSMAENTTAVGTVTATGGQTPYTFSISGGADSALFGINSSTGALVFLVAPDFDAPGDADTDNDYELTVRVASAGGAYNEQNMTVTVTAALNTTIAYLSSTGNDGTAALGDSGLPYATPEAACAALIAAHPNTSTTITLTGNFNGTGVIPSEIYNEGTTSYLKIDGDGFNWNTMQLEPQAGGVFSRLTLKDINVSSLAVTEGVSGSATVAFGSIHNEGTVNVTTADFSHPGTPAGADGTTGTAAFDGVGNTGATGVGGPGSKGEDIVSTGGTGTDGANGRSAWSIYLFEGTGFVQADYITVNCLGCPGGNGGAGGGNTSAQGGTGGLGADGFDDGMSTPANGYDGGPGGDISITGGTGGNGGNGGEGGTIYANAGINVAGSSLGGGPNGFGGSGGTVNGSGGSGGGGGNGVNGGSAGATGATGSATVSSPGSGGANGASGNSGSLTIV